MRPENVSDAAWERAVTIAREDRHRLARLVRSGRVRRDPRARVVLPLPAPRLNPTIRRKRKNGRR